MSDDLSNAKMSVQAELLAEDVEERAIAADNPAIAATLRTMAEGLRTEAAYWSRRDLRAERLEQLEDLQDEARR